MERIITNKFKMTTDIPESITTADKIETRLGALEFFDGYPSHETAQLCYDNLLFMRGVEIFLNWMPAESMFALREGFRKTGVVSRWDRSLFGTYDPYYEIKH
jgi:hypothetical protein